MLLFIIYSILIIVLWLYLLSETYLNYLRHAQKVKHEYGKTQEALTWDRNWSPRRKRNYVHENEDSYTTWLIRILQRLNTLEMYRTWLWLLANRHFSSATALSPIYRTRIASSFELCVLPLYRVQNTTNALQLALWQVQLESFILSCHAGYETKTAAA